MSYRLTKPLDRLCQELERAFPEVLAAIDGFRTPFLGGTRDGFRVVEVFNVTDTKAEEILSFAERLASRHFDETGELLTFSVWDCQQTRELFEEDVLAIEMSRVRLSVDTREVAATCCTRQESASPRLATAYAALPSVSASWSLGVPASRSMANALLSFIPRFLLKREDAAGVSDRWEGRGESSSRIERAFGKAA